MTRKAEGKSPLTTSSYEQRIKDLLAFTKVTALPDLTTNHIRFWLVSLRERKLNPSTVDVYYRCVKSWFNWMIGEGYLDRSPMANIQHPSLPKPVVKPFTMADIHRILIMCNGNSFLDVRNRAIILLFLDTGLRLNEMVNIKIADISDDLEIIKVWGKGAKERRVRVGMVARKALIKYWHYRQETPHYDNLWLTEERRPMKREGLKMMVRKITERAGVTDAKRGAHTFRHTCAINFLRNKGESFTLQILLGHSTLVMTRRYVSTLGEDDMIKQHRISSPVDNMKL